MIRNKKANFPDVAAWIVVSIMLGMIIVFGLVIADRINDRVQTIDENVINNQTKQASQDHYTTINDSFDYIVPMLYLAFLIFSVVAARLIPSSSKLVIVTIFSLILLQFAAMAMNNFWNDFAANSIVSAQLATMTFFPFIMRNMVYFVFIYNMAVGFALLTKNE